MKNKLQIAMGSNVKMWLYKNTGLLGLNVYENQTTGLMPGLWLYNHSYPQKIGYNRPARGSRHQTSGQHLA